MKCPGDKEFSPLNETQRNQVIDALRKQKTGTLATVQKALGIDKVTLKKKYKDATSIPIYVLNLENDKDREINGDWFYSTIVINGLD